MPLKNCRRQSYLLPTAKRCFAAASFNRYRRRRFCRLTRVHLQLPRSNTCRLGEGANASSGPPFFTNLLQKLVVFVSIYAFLFTPKMKKNASKWKVFACFWPQNEPVFDEFCPFFELWRLGRNNKDVFYIIVLQPFRWIIYRKVLQITVVTVIFEASIFSLYTI